MNRRLAACAIFLLISFSVTVIAETAGSSPAPKTPVAPAVKTPVPAATAVPAANTTFPVKSITAVEGNVQPAQSDTVQVAPLPAEKPVFGWVQNERFQTGPAHLFIQGTAFAGVASGLALSVKGVSVLFSGAGNNFDSKTMHNGLLMAVSGSLISSLFSVFLTSIK